MLCGASGNAGSGNIMAGAPETNLNFVITVFGEFIIEVLLGCNADCTKFEITSSVVGL